MFDLGRAAKSLELSVSSSPHILIGIKIDRPDCQKIWYM